MKTHATIAAISLTFASAAFAAGGKHDHAHEHQPMHGGVVVEVRDMDYELVAKPEAIQLHVRDHGKPADVSKASANVTLLTGAEKQEVELKPAVIFEVAYEEIQKSQSYSSGYALRFPRLVRVRDDKSLEEADSLERVESLYRVQRGRNNSR